MPHSAQLRSNLLRDYAGKEKVMKQAALLANYWVMEQEASSGMISQAMP